MIIAALLAITGCLILSGWYATERRKRLSPAWREERIRAWIEKPLKSPCEVVGHEFTVNPHVCDWCQDDRLVDGFKGHFYTDGSNRLIAVIQSPGDFWLRGEDVECDRSLPTYKTRPMKIRSAALIYQAGVNPYNPSQYQAQRAIEAWRCR